MAKNRDPFVWSFGWWVEKDKAWFVESKHNILFCVDLKKRVCEEAVYIPDTSPKKYALTPLCMKYEREIWCIPGKGHSIWVYHLDDKVFHEIDLKTPGRKNMLANFFIWNDALFIVPLWWNKVIEVNLYTKKIENYHTICEKDLAGESVMVDDSIYMVSYEFDKIYEFELKQKELKIHTIPNNDNKKFQCICFDGEKFWLSGYKKEVYVWSKKDNSLITIDGFPSDFGVYDFSKDTNGQIDCITNCYEYPSFSFSVVIEDYVWFIPCQTNKIIYIHKNTFQVSVYEIEDEQENKKSILSRAPGKECKYGIEYIRDQRYIGLFSTKNNRILEIDAKEFSHQWIDYYFSKKCMKQCNDIFKGLYSEKDVLEMLIYKMGLRTEGITDSIDVNNVGNKIHHKVKREQCLKL